MTSSVCVDASLIIRTLVPDTFSDEAESLLQDWQQQAIVLVAPALLAFEVTSALRRLVYLNTISSTASDAAFANFQRIDIRLSTRRAIIPLAWKLAKDLNRPRAYDTSYLALAQLSGCEFWTADERIYNAVKHRLSWVKWVGNYKSLQGSADGEG